MKKNKKHSGNKNGKNPPKTQDDVYGIDEKIDDEVNEKIYVGMACKKYENFHIVVGLE